MNELIYTDIVNKSIVEFVVSPGVTELKQILHGQGMLEHGTFQGCLNLEKIILPSSIKRIGGKAFDSCRDLEKIILPDSVQYVDTKAFRECGNLRGIILPDRIMEIEADTFNGCRRMSTVVFPSSLKMIGSSSFKNCTELSGMILPKGLVEIGDSAFQDCVSLTSVVFPEGVKMIGLNAFKDCIGLSKVVLPRSLIHVSSTAFQGCANLFDIKPGSIDVMEMLSPEMKKYCSNSITNSSIFEAIRDLKTELDKREVCTCNIDISTPINRIYEMTRELKLINKSTARFNELASEGTLKNESLIKLIEEVNKVVF